jgi:type IVB pilus formation R64 PilN family outer membrane protein
MMKKMISRFVAAIFILSSIFAVAACDYDFNFPMMRSTDKAVESTAWKSGYETKKLTTRKPAVEVNSSYYVSPNTIDLQDPQSAWLNRKINVQAQDLPLDFVLARILRNTGANVEFQTGMNSSKPITISYYGTIKGALDRIASILNVAYRVKGKQIYWEAFVTRTYDVSFMPGTSNYSVGKTSGTSSGSSGSTAASGTVVNAQLGSDEFSNLTGQLSVWKDLAEALNQLKSTDGKVMVSESTTTVTVYDHPSNVAAITNYINQLNNDLSRQVVLQVQVLEVTLSKNFAFGIDWNSVQHYMNTSITEKGSLFDATNVSGVVSNGASTTALSSFGIGSAATTTFINALGQQGRVSVVTQPRVVTMNNQVAEVLITRDTAYLQSVSTTITGTSGTATTSLTPGVVTDGLTLHLLPKIQGNKVFLEISSNLVTLTSLNTINNKGVAPGTADNTADFEQIQIPTLAQKQFNQRTVITSGSTLVIAGYQQISNQNSRAQYFGIQLLGGRGAEKGNTQTIVLITPTIIGAY